MADNLQGYTCERRSQHIIDGSECIKAFVHYCSEAAKRHQVGRREALLLAHSEQDDNYVSELDIMSRTQFPESWLWGVVTLPECKSTSITTKGYLKDFIATCLSKAHGICVADPLEMKVMKDFFIDLKLPYAAVRNEQLEIKAVLYNYLDEEIQVRVELMETEQVCSAASKKRKYRMPDVYINSMSSIAVPFVIIPMALGLHSIEVKATVYELFLIDGVKKDLRVLAEGRQTKKEVVTMVLNPSEHGELLSHTTQVAISGFPLGGLIAPALRQRLTAYMVKVFGMAYQLISINEDVLCSALKWLVMNAQQPDGAFKEYAPVYYREMVGRVWEEDADASLTAFVLIAMQESRHVCEERVNSLHDSMKKASEFLARRIHSLANPYAVALTTYTLANEGQHLLDRFSSISELVHPHHGAAQPMMHTASIKHRLPKTNTAPSAPIAH
ncbi:hypothetical protein AAFF_G00307060 [Aldrovandia affinis]|uniref:Alpha-2-macroglobulin domain-containing protein n=1 Tax=Aldrovandia affinis TaxID=143900 RepID=A0AAD7R7X9_9TELE|nr:hypothetical protein AAFF_G00307060 [Aldrovandia affinis]